MEEKAGHLIGKGLRFTIVAGRFNEIVTESLIGGAIDCLTRHGVSENDIVLYRVPGSFEIPQVAMKLTGDDSDAVICLGTLIRGGTPHFDILASQVVKDLSTIGIQSGKPVTFGVITADTQEQAIERAGSKAGNKGWQAALSALEMSNLWKDIEG
ncbi:MAG: 6,7-dimethyl-8-ribityllumazine synthase [Candidatus Krumholzibacteria bacterium]|nr:6,7-dimethyl-8-ribityllumazine synthase [Candidatus Krumholzibacteria bacterium]